MPPVRPMLAKSVAGVPDPEKHGGLLFEPKWDGSGRRAPAGRAASG